jgi:hypothetical protein
MKRVIIIVGLFFAGMFVSQAQEYCDTLKWKIIKTNYGDWDGIRFHAFGNLDNAVMNIDTLSILNLEMVVVNISNNTFFANETYSTTIYYYIYVDTVPIIWTKITTQSTLKKKISPNDTVKIVASYFGINLLDDINSIKEHSDIDLEQITHWEMIIGMGYTETDGFYADSVFYAGADTSIFYVVKTPVGIVGTERAPSLPQIFPNPARLQFTVTNTENASLYLYNMVGQEVLQTYSTEENTVINVNTLPQGLYVLKVVKNGVLSTYKVVVSY